MNKRSKATRTFITIFQVIMIAVAVLLGIGTKFFDLALGFDPELLDVAFWIALGLSTVLTFVMFYGTSSISTNKEYGDNDDYLVKIKNVNEINTITGLEYAEDFLEEHFLDKKYEKVQKKLKNKIERVKKRTDKKGFNLVEPDKNIFKPRTWYRWFNKSILFKRLYAKYIKLKEKMESPTLKDELKYTYVKGIFRVTKAYLSDGMKKYNMDIDPDKPVSATSVQVKKGGQKLAISLIVTLMGTSIAFNAITQGFDSEFFIDLAMKVISYAITILNGFLFGKTFFNDVILDFEIKRENLLQKYIRWLKANQPNIWNASLQNRRDIQQMEADATAKLRLEEAKITDKAAAIEKAIENSAT